MTQKNTLLIVGLITLFTVSINAAESAPVAQETQESILSLSERLEKLQQEVKNINNEVAALNGQPVPLKLRAQRGAAIRKITELQKEAAELKTKVSN